MRRKPLPRHTVLRVGLTRRYWLLPRRQPPAPVLTRRMVYLAVSQGRVDPAEGPAC